MIIIVIYIKLSRQLLEVVGGDGRASAGQSQAIQAVRGAGGIILTGNGRQLHKCLFSVQVLDKLLERDKEIQRLSETGKLRTIRSCRKPASF